MSIFEAIILGIVQGVTEFLPISSSGHLVLLQYIFGISQSNLFFTVMLHLGTLIAVFAVFGKDILELAKRPFSKDSINVIAATLVTGIMYILLKGFVDSAFDGSSLWIGFLYSALLLWFAGSKAECKNRELSLWNALYIGFMQGVALFPGISRSGSTIGGGILSGTDRNKVAEFSFILSIPAILGGTVTEISHIRLDSVPWLPVVIGTLCASISGYITIRFMLKLIANKKLSVFTPYLLAMAGIAYIIIN